MKSLRIKMHKIMLSVHGSSVIAVRLLISYILSSRVTFLKIILPYGVNLFLRLFFKYLLPGLAILGILLQLSLFSAHPIKIAKSKQVKTIHAIALNNSKKGKTSATKQ